MVYSVERETEGRFSFVAHATGVHPLFGIVQAAFSQDLISLSLGYGAMAGSFVTGASLLFFQRYVYGHSEDSVLLSHRG